LGTFIHVYVYCRDFDIRFIIDFPNLGSTYNGGWCTATESDETLITRPSREVNVK